MTGMSRPSGLQGDWYIPGSNAFLLSDVLLAIWRMDLRALSHSDVARNTTAVNPAFGHLHSTGISMKLGPSINLCLKDGCQRWRKGL
jgi:hypothetical protein